MRRLLPTAKTTLHPAYGHDHRRKSLRFAPRLDDSICFLLLNHSTRDRHPGRQESPLARIGSRRECHPRRRHRTGRHPTPERTVVRAWTWPLILSSLRRSALRLSGLPSPGGPSLLRGHRTAWWRPVEDCLWRTWTRWRCWLDRLPRPQFLRPQNAPRGQEAEQVQQASAVSRPHVRWPMLEGQHSDPHLCRPAPTRTPEPVPASQRAAKALPRHPTAAEIEQSPHHAATRCTPLARSAAANSHSSASTLPRGLQSASR
jgi:hypothetical protein